MCAHLFVFRFAITIPSFRVVLTFSQSRKRTATLDVAPFLTDPREFEGSTPGRSVFGVYVIRGIACRSPNVTLTLSQCFPRLFGCDGKKTNCPECQ